MKQKFERDLADINYKDWDFNIVPDNDRLYLQIGFWAYDTTRPLHEQADREYQTCRKWFLSPHMTKSEVVQTALKAVLAAEEHEARECFLYKGKPVFGPHFNIDRLFDVCGQTDALDARKAA